MCSRSRCERQLSAQGVGLVAHHQKRLGSADWAGIGEIGEPLRAVLNAFGESLRILQTVRLIRKPRLAGRERIGEQEDRRIGLRQAAGHDPVL